ncbi:hypothetical protein V6N13_078708 [Hibiscus sabdariffa]|uniref:Uncharacterized protein n=1 Tax=Hibiscus sabdariffa TaxID=183260 RepID=A0ABR2RP81_9ROSI
MLEKNKVLFLWAMGINEDKYACQMQHDGNCRLPDTLFVIPISSYSITIPLILPRRMSPCYSANKLLDLTTRLSLPKAKQLPFLSTVLFASSFNQFTHNLISLLCLDHFCHSGQVSCWWS